MEKQVSRKEETRRRLLEAAGKGFRSQGYAGVGVDGIAKEAGATSGAFYAHLGSKDGAFRLAVEQGLDEVVVGIPQFQKDFGKGWVEAFVDYYLGEAHLKDRECGCAMTTLSPEVVRADKSLHQLYDKKMNRIADLMANGLKGKTLEEKRAKAWSILSILIGALTLARAVGNKKRAEEICSSARQTVLDLIK